MGDEIIPAFHLKEAGLFDPGSRPPNSRVNGGGFRNSRPEKLSDFSRYTLQAVRAHG